MTRFRIAILLGALLLFGGHAVQAASLPLFLIGFLAALSDALTSPQIARQLGGNITSSIAVLKVCWQQVLLPERQEEEGTATQALRIE
ncbi:hypothetical protein ACKJSM_09115 [Pseudomonas sp. PHC1]|uniref:hypothetical protein n=1 Tax=Pseudomonas sp. PHC1 TaxID=3384759 RepID=UPI00396F6276